MEPQGKPASSPVSEESTSEPEQEPQASSKKRKRDKAEVKEAESEEPCQVHKSAKTNHGGQFFSPKRRGEREAAEDNENEQGLVLWNGAI